MRTLIFAFLLLFTNDAFARSCLVNLPQGHHAIAATYDDSGHCIIKSCMPTYKLFQNKCYKNNEYENLIAKEKICVSSGGSYEQITYPARYFTCTCPDDKFNVSDKCVAYSAEDCETEHVMEQHIERNNLKAVQQCVRKDKNLIKGLDAKIIEFALKTHDYNILDFLLDNGLVLNDRDIIDAGVYNNVDKSWYSAGLKTSFDTQEIEYVVDLDRNFELIKHLVDDKQVINLRDDRKGIFAEHVASQQRKYTYDEKNLNSACDTLEFCLEKSSFDARNNADILYEIIQGLDHGFSDHKGFPFEYLKCARANGLNFKLKDGNNPLDYLTPAHNLGPQEYKWLIAEIKRDLRDVDFTNSLKKFCGDDYIYGSPAREYEEDVSIIQEFLNAGAEITDKTIKAAKEYERIDKKSCGNGFRCSRKFDAVCSFVPENKMCAEQIEEVSEKRNKYQEVDDKIKGREQSLPNRMLGAAAIGATGIGGMMVASALTEQHADEDSERDMAAFLNTLRCEYGDSKSVRGGTTNVELPGGNELINLYAQYATLANDLKIRKEALGIKPGIESDVVIDKSTTGLYDDVGTGVVGGVYASIARALQDPNGEDAKKWNLQKSETGDSLETGTILTGTGAIGGAVGNVMINGWDGKGDKKEEKDK